MIIGFLTPFPFQKCILSYTYLIFKECLVKCQNVRYSTLKSNPFLFVNFFVHYYTGSSLTWFEWSEENNTLTPGQTPENVPNNASCMTLYGDLLAIGTSEGLIYLYHLNESTLLDVDPNRTNSDESTSSDEESKSVPYNWDPVLSFKRMAIRHKTTTMRLVESALAQPIHTFSLLGCDIVSAIAISDGGYGPTVAAVGIDTNEAWVQHVHLFSWSR